ncbi:TPA: NUDIX domain-containing protein [Streptococcus suis]
MKRDSTKPSYPDYYEATAGGSALFGEIAEQAILREVREETGIELTADQLRHHTHFVAHDDQFLSPMMTSVSSTATGQKPIGTNLLSNSKPKKLATLSGSHWKN